MSKVIKSAKVKPSCNDVLQLRVNECKNFGVLVLGKNFVKELDFDSEKPVTTVYLNASRARKLAFSLLSAANKLDRST